MARLWRELTGASHPEESGQEIDTLLPLRVICIVGGWSIARSARKSTRNPVGFGAPLVLVALLMMKSSVFVPATRLLVMTNGVKPPKPALVSPVLTPLTRMSVPALSTAHAPVSLTLLMSYPVRLIDV